MDFTYIALRPLRVGDSIRQAGEEVPEAETWLRPDSYVRQGYLTMVEKRRGPGRPKAVAADQQ